ncbi:MAG TPA: DoxX family protein [Polyangia bacterium]|nr:DoxX family protein [Polyangia bacterium]
MDTTFNTVANIATTSPITSTRAATTGRAAVWTGRIMSGLIAALLMLDAAVKLVRLEPVVKGTVELGYPIASIVPIGIILLSCVVLYLVPRTAVLGAVLLTGYLGGAIATHVRVGHPLLSHTLFPIYVAAFIWGGLYLRDRRARALLARRAA